MNDQPAAKQGGLGHTIVRWTHRALVAVVCVAMFAMMILTTADVAGRYFFAFPIRGAFELVTFLLGILTFAALPLVTWDEKHISVAIFERWTSGAVKFGLDLVMSTISTLVMGAIAYRMWIQANLMAEGQHVTGYLEWPIAPVAYFMSVLSGLSTIILAIITFRKLIGRGPSPHHYDGSV